MNEVNIRCYRIGGTPNAVLVAKTTKSEDPKTSGIWLPRSQCRRIFYTGINKDGWQLIEIDIPEWLARKKGLA